MEAKYCYPERMVSTTPTLIIGAGPAGLAMAGRLHQQGLPFLIVEKSKEIATSWQHHYDRLCLHTVKEFSHLPHQPFAEEVPRYVPRKTLVAYYEQYARDRNIQPIGGQEITSVKRAGQDWISTAADGKQYRSRQVVVCTGFNRVMRMPSYPGMDRFEGELFHSRFYKNGTPYAGKKVLVVGMGNSGAEIAVDLHEHGAIPFQSVRNEVHIVLRDLGGRPTQLTSMKLRKLPFWLGDAIGGLLVKIFVGNIARYGLRRPKLPPAKQLRLYGKTPVIDVGTLDILKSGHLTVLPGIERFTPTGVRFTDGREEGFDAVVLATGYQAKVEAFVENTEGLFNELGLPRAPFVPQHPGLFFLGFDAYTSGILESIHRQSGVILEEMLRTQVVLNAADSASQ
jgi:cation diffusion facilitator CzcD-associated flavoprotein CzcO